MSVATAAKVTTATATTSAATATTSAATATTSTATIAAAVIDGAVVANPNVCRFFLRGVCRFGPRCRFSHVFDGGDNGSNTGTTAAPSANLKISGENNAQEEQSQPSTSTKNHHNWVNAPIFVPTGRTLGAIVTNNSDQSACAVAAEEKQEIAGVSNKSWAEVVGVGIHAHAGSVNGIVKKPKSMDMICPYEGPCPYGNYCMFAIHLEPCKMCDQYCLHPTDLAQRRKHNQECLQQHEQAMELSFAIARSKDKTCGICFDTIMEKAGREKRFGILPNCSHIFCLECIRKWRQAKQFEHKITRSCPECRVSSDFVCPSAFWVETKEDKNKLLDDYRSALGIKDCKYFKKGEGKCPFGNKCFYKHALPNGDLVDVGCPKRSRKLHRSGNEIIDLLDIYLWEFVDHRDFLDMLSNTSDEGDSDWSDE